MNTADFYVYILQCNDNSYYIGHTDNIERRLEEHQSGACAGYTAKRLPVKLVFIETCPSRAEALDIEMQMKKWSHRKKEFLIQNGWGKMRAIARKLKLEKQ